MSSPLSNSVARFAQYLHPSPTSPFTIIDDILSIVILAGFAGTLAVSFFLSPPHHRHIIPPSHPRPTLDPLGASLLQHQHKTQCQYKFQIVQLCLSRDTCGAWGSVPRLRRPNLDMLLHENWLGRATHPACHYLPIPYLSARMERKDDGGR
jgi:hypothetical protein